MDFNIFYGSPIIPKSPLTKQIGELIRTSYYRYDKLHDGTLFEIFDPIVGYICNSNYILITFKDSHVLKIKRSFNLAEVFLNARLIWVGISGNVFDEKIRFRHMIY